MLPGNSYEYKNSLGAKYGGAEVWSGGTKVVKEANAPVLYRIALLNPFQIRILGDLEKMQFDSVIQALA